MKTENIRKPSKASASSPTNSSGSRKKLPSSTIGVQELTPQSASKVRKFTTQVAQKDAEAMLDSELYSYRPGYGDEKNGRRLGRKLVSWNIHMEREVLLCIVYECARKNIKLPWDDIAERLSYEKETTGSTIEQHLAKLRVTMFNNGQWVPPLMGRTKPTYSGNARGIVRMNPQERDAEPETRLVLWTEDLSGLVSPDDVEKNLKIGGAYNPKMIEELDEESASIHNEMVRRMRRKFKGGPDCIPSQALPYKMRTPSKRKQKVEDEVDPADLPSDEDFDPSPSKRTRFSNRNKNRGRITLAQDNSDLEAEVVDDELLEDTKMEQTNVMMDLFNNSLIQDSGDIMGANFGHTAYPEADFGTDGDGEGDDYDVGPYESDQRNDYPNAELMVSDGIVGPNSFRFMSDNHGLDSSTSYANQLSNISRKDVSQYSNNGTAQAQSQRMLFNPQTMASFQGHSQQMLFSPQTMGHNQSLIYPSQNNQVAPDFNLGGYSAGITGLFNPVADNFHFDPFGATVENNSVLPQITSNEQHSFLSESFPKNQQILTNFAQQIDPSVDHQLMTNFDFGFNPMVPLPEDYSTGEQQDATNNEIDYKGGEYRTSGVDLSEDLDINFMIDQMGTHQAVTTTDDQTMMEQAAVMSYDNHYNME